MKKIITLTKNRLARLSDKESFLMPDNLVFEFQSIGYDLTHAYITLKNGDKKVRLPLSKELTVPNDLLFAGLLYGSIHAYLDGILLKEWDILPIRIFESKEDVYCVDFLLEIENRLAKLEDEFVSLEKHNDVVEKVNEVIEKQNEIADTVSEIKETFASDIL